VRAPLPPAPAEGEHARPHVRHGGRQSGRSPRWRGRHIDRVPGRRARRRPCEVGGASGTTTCTGRRARPTGASRAPLTAAGSSAWAASRAWAQGPGGAAGPSTIGPGGARPSGPYAPGGAARPARRPYARNRGRHNGRAPARRIQHDGRATRRRGRHKAVHLGGTSDTTAAHPGGAARLAAVRRGRSARRIGRTHGTAAGTTTCARSACPVRCDHISRDTLGHDRRGRHVRP